MTKTVALSHNFFLSLFLVSACLFVTSCAPIPRSSLSLVAEDTVVNVNFDSKGKETTITKGVDRIVLRKEIDEALAEGKLKTLNEITIMKNETTGKNTCYVDVCTYVRCKRREIDPKADGSCP